MTASTSPRPGVVHESVRTSSSTNVNPVTGERLQSVLCTRLGLRFVAGNLVVRFDAKQMDLTAEQSPAEAL